MYGHERSLVQRYRDQPFALIGVNSDADREVARRAVKEEDLPWRSFWNGPDGIEGPISTRWNVKSWPKVYVLDHQGVIRFQDVRGEALDAAIEQLLPAAREAGGR